MTVDLITSVLHRCYMIIRGCVTAVVQSDRCLLYPNFGVGLVANTLSKPVLIMGFVQ